MNTMLIAAVVAITMALLFYTIGVWWERLERELAGRHLVFFCLGLLCDIAGTMLMASFAQGGATQAGSLLLSLHGSTGAAAIVLMAFHAVWAAIVLIRNREREKRTFHRFSVLVWGIWLIPYFSGVVMGMRG